MNLLKAASILDAKIISTQNELNDLSFNQISIDSRTLEPGNLFIAIRGEELDGHNYVEQAKEKGAIACVVDHEIKIDIPQLIVKDTTKALGELALEHRNQFSIPFASVTGSYGKTTVKEMIASILRQCGNVLANKGNLNNYWGVPLTLLQLKPEHQYAVLELGANNPGEISYVTNLVKPKVALITVAAAAHLLGFGDIHHVAKYKAEIFEGLSSDGTAILNLDDAHFDFWKNIIAQKKNKFLTFSVEKNNADFTGKILKIDSEGKALVQINTPKGSFEAQLPLPGHHQFMNALAASAVCFALDIPLQAMKAGLEAVEPVKGRVNLKRGISDTRIIDDSYNASPNAVKAGLQLLAHFSAPRIAVLGDMLELGDHAASYHHEVGEFARTLSIEKLYGYGPLSKNTVNAFGANAEHFSDQALLIEELKKQLQPGMTLLIKGSLGMRMANIVSALVEEK